MGKIGFGYGSEWHVLRWLGYHRGELARRVTAVTGGEAVEWLDFGFSAANAPGKQGFLHPTALVGVKLRYSQRV